MVKIMRERVLTGLDQHSILMQALASFTTEGRASEVKDKVSSRSDSLFGHEFSIFKTEGTLPRSEAALNTNRRFQNLDKLKIT